MNESITEFMKCNRGIGGELKETRILNYTFKEVSKLKYLRMQISNANEREEIVEDRVMAGK